MRMPVTKAMILSLFWLCACSAEVSDGGEEPKSEDGADVATIGQKLDPSKLVYAWHPSGVALIKVYPTSTFWKGESIKIGKSDLVMQADGNLVLYDERGRQPQFARWSSGTWAGSSAGTGDHATMQSDGNFVVYDKNGRPVGNRSNTCCRSGLFLAVQSDGNLVIYDSSWRVYWSTGTYH